MRCKDMPGRNEKRYCQIIICAKCKNSGGTLINVDGHWEHPHCDRPTNVEYLERVRQAEVQQAFDEGKIKCQLCDEHPAMGRIKNKLNGKVLLVCESCLAMVTDNAKRVEEEAKCQ